jgi:hypothetical protein
MNKLEKKIKKLITDKTKENHYYTFENLINKNDIIDYYIIKKNNHINVYYTYYYNKYKEDKYINSKLIINLWSNN